jgi:hypothetical protein
MNAKLVCQTVGVALICDHHKDTNKYALFVWLISHQPAVLFSQNKPAPATSHQPSEQADD